MMWEVNWKAVYKTWDLRLCPSNLGTLESDYVRVFPIIDDRGCGQWSGGPIDNHWFLWHGSMKTATWTWRKEWFQPGAASPFPVETPPPQISLYSNWGVTGGKNFGVAFFDLPAISMPRNNIVSLINFFIPLAMAYHWPVTPNSWAQQEHMCKVVHPTIKWWQVSFISTY